MSLFEVQSMIAILNKKSKSNGGPMTNEKLDELMSEHREKYDWIK